MKKEIHPTFYTDAQVICACGNTWTTGSTVKTIRTDVCSNCHPFYTGEQRIVDSEGQVDRFYKRLQARQEYIDKKEAFEAARTSPERPVEELELGDRNTKVLAKAGLTTVGPILEKFLGGDEALLAIDGFGRKGLADLKKRLRHFGYTIPEMAEEASS